MVVPVIDMKKIGENIASLRVRRGISVRELQGLLGFASPQSIYKWQRGEMLPTIENLLALAHIFAVPVEEIVTVEYRGMAGKEEESCFYSVKESGREDTEWRKQS